MRIFNEPNTHGGWKCKICKTSAPRPVVLIAKDGTQEGWNMQAEQYHLHCIELTEYDDAIGNIVLAMKVSSPE